MASHQAKKQYSGIHANQTKVTSYFNVAPPCSTTNPAFISSKLETSQSPALPEEIQSSLLNVGMRVRKSVPEGYKTGSQYSAFKLFSSAPVTEPVLATPSNGHSLTNNYVRRELSPFCGLMKTGGLAQQAYIPDEDDVPFLSSQCSTITDVSVGGIGSIKRRMDEEEDEYEEWDQTRNETRQIAMPKSRRKDATATSKSSSVRMTQGSVTRDDDFEEAGFLEEYDDVDEEDMDYE